jgi:cytochrome oxidase assembly protein ShyY1
VLAPGRPVDPQDEWRRVSAEGTYLDEQSVVVRYQTRDGASGVDVVTPLRVEPGGTLLLVNRGWLRTSNAGDASPDLPAAPAGEVHVVGWVRADATGDSAAVTDGTTRAVSSSRIGAALDAPVYGGFVDLVSEDPEPAEPLVHAERPDLTEGPHFFYGLQWWFFAALAVFGFGYLAWDERRKLRAVAEPEAADQEPSVTA